MVDVDPAYLDLGAPAFMSEALRAPRRRVWSSTPAASARRSEAACRSLDLALALAAILFLLPLLVVIALMVRAQDGGPALFAHKRIGRGGQLFPCLKFRSMVTDADARLAALLDSDETARIEWERDQKLRRDPRTTAFGRFLRRSSLDELPQLFNVVRGDMSLVGPRPIVAAEAKRYGRALRRYCAVKPGITGLWQISGRSDVNYRRRVVMDCAYVRRRSFVLNCRIIVVTIPALLMQRGAY